MDWYFKMLIWISLGVVAPYCIIQITLLLLGYNLMDDPDAWRFLKGDIKKIFIKLRN